MIKTPRLKLMSGYNFRTNHSHSLNYYLSCNYPFSLKAEIASMKEKRITYLDLKSTVGVGNFWNNGRGCGVLIVYVVEKELVTLVKNKHYFILLTF